MNEAQDRRAQGRIRVLLCEDQELVRAGIAGIFARMPDAEVVAEAGDGEEAVRLWKRLRPDITIMDLNMPKVNGFEAIARIRNEDAHARVLVLTGTAAEADLRGAMEEGVDGYLIKDADPLEFFEAVRAVAAGRRHVSAQVVPQLMRLYQESRRGGSGPELTERETRVLRMVAEGKVYKEIWPVLGVSERTVKNAVESAREKLGAVNRENAISIAKDLGII